MHFFFLFIGCCSPGPKTAFRATIVAIIGLVACAALISFDATFLARPYTCILTPSCATSYSSNATFALGLEQSFFRVFNQFGPFQSYGESQVKYLFQAIQLGIGILCFIICLLYIIIYYACSSKAKEQVRPSSSSDDDEQYQPSYFAPQLPPPPPQQQLPPYASSQVVPFQPEYQPAPSVMPPIMPPSAVYQPAFMPTQPVYQPVPTMVPPQPNYQLPPALVPARSGHQSSSLSAQPGYYPSPAPPPSVEQNIYAYQPVAPVRQPQPPPGVIPWNANRRY
jgi:hypothetical protein